MLSLVLSLVLVVGLSSCGDRGPDHEIYEIVVPRGTGDALRAGEKITLMPSLLEFEVGDTIRIRNEDLEDQSVGPYKVDAGEEFELTFGSPGRFTGTCVLSEDEKYEIIIR